MIFSVCFSLSDRFVLIWIIEKKDRVHGELSTFSLCFLSFNSQSNCTISYGKTYEDLFYWLGIHLLYYQRSTHHTRNYCAFRIIIIKRTYNELLLELLQCSKEITFYYKWMTSVLPKWLVWMTSICYCLGNWSSFA